MEHSAEYNGKGSSHQTPVLSGVTLAAILPDGNGGFMPCPELLTEDELVRYLRIPEVSSAKDYHNVIENLKRMHDLPRIHVCGKPLYPREALRQWIQEKTTNGR